ncbi:MAG: hypothetical protein ACI9F9_001629 [Candidatus Paceibacteria bacterium]|jgi:hypothetical protein
MRLTCLILFLALGSSDSLAAAAALRSETESPWSMEVIPSPAMGSARLPNVTDGADGKLYLTWAEDRADLTVLLFSTLGEDGWEEPHEFARSDHFFLNWADFPGLVADHEGHLLAYWLLRDGTRHGYTAQISLSSDAGLTWSPTQRLHEDKTSGEHGFVSVVPARTGGFLAVWLDGRNITPGEDGHGTGSMALYSRKILTTGTLGAERVIDERVCDCCQTTLAAHPGEDPLVAYRDRDQEEVRDISIARLTSEGWSQPMPLHQDGWLIAGCPVNGPQLALTDSHQFVAWFTGAGEGGGSVYAGTALKGQLGFGFPIHIDAGSPVGRVDIAALGAGYALVTWLEHTEASSGEWRAQVVAAGKRIGDPLALSSITTERSSGFLRMAPVSGGVVVAWTVPGKPSSIETARVLVRVPDGK